MTRRFYFNDLQHLNNAVCKKHLGIGGFANVRVYSCTESHDEEQCICEKQFVVKQLRHDYENIYNKEDLLKQYNRNKLLFKNEFEVGKQLKHPNVIETLDMDCNLNCIAFENFIGTDMLDYLNENKEMNVRRNLGYFAQALCGIEYMHGQGIAHMDIKLENILINEQKNRVKVIDFGYSIVFQTKHTKFLMSRPCGTECYFPPEFYHRLQFECDKVDIWCLGIVLYNLVFDRMPWEHSSSMKSVTFKEFEEYMSRHSLHPGLFDFDKIHELTSQDKEILIDIFFGCLSLNPRNRMSIQEFREKFQQLSFLN
jgi:serine/threonine protein kinase